MAMHDAYGRAAGTLIGRAFARHASFCKCGLQKVTRRDKRCIEARENTSAAETLMGRAFARHERTATSECAENPYGAHVCAIRKFDAVETLTGRAFAPHDPLTVMPRASRRGALFRGRSPIPLTRRLGHRGTGSKRGPLRAAPSRL